MEVYTLIDILEKSIKKNGDVVLTTKHLLNILRMIERQNQEPDITDLYAEYKAEDYGNKQ